MKQEILDLFKSIDTPIQKKVSNEKSSKEFLRSLEKANEAYTKMSFENMREERKIKQINSEYSKNYLLG